MSDFKFDWQPWARLQLIGAAQFIFVGALITYFYPQKYYQLALINGGASLFMLVTEYIKVPLITTNYFFRGLLCMASAGAALLLAPCHPGGFCMIFACLTFWKAAANGEPRKKTERR
jgi:hypothetical protein